MAAIKVRFDSNAGYSRGIRQVLLAEQDFAATPRLDLRKKNPERERKIDELAELTYCSRSGHFPSSAVPERTNIPDREHTHGTSE